MTRMQKNRVKKKNNPAQDGAACLLRMKPAVVLQNKFASAGKRKSLAVQLCVAEVSAPRIPSK